MKKRIRTQPTNPYYSNEPAVARGLIAGKAPVQSASLGNQPPKMVDKKPGKLAGLAGFVDKKKPPAKQAHIPALKAGATPAKTKFPTQGGGHLRMSGSPNAHKFGGMRLKV